ncbi:phage tail protein I [Marinomonas mediterranea]|uniref:phage tail protein I n=1 Tax=Marinomonas mediterranea TaxID=119864 RepID=UPI00234A0529|nr:phage tail protein I [Marinomonas mediterranea]WCN11286.1 phage tail protein I [Marinomonas mediterranea]WCN15351.1 phage tail protein I [Marinomonas mediterranea]
MTQSLLPSNSSELEQCLDQLAAQRLSFDLSLADTNPLTCVAESLPILAASWKVDVRGLNERESRELIANAWEIHRYKGTAHAVKKALSSVFSKVQIQEFKTPYVFDAVVTLGGDPNQVFDDEKFATAKRLANEAKNLRSRFGEFVIALPEAQASVIKTDAASTNSMSLSSSLSLNANCTVKCKGAIQWTL